MSLFMIVLNAKFTLLNNSRFREDLPDRINRAEIVAA